MSYLPSGENLLVNGNFELQQMYNGGSAISTAIPQYVFDQFYLDPGTGSPTVTAVQQTITTLPGARLQAQISVNTKGTTVWAFWQPIEQTIVIPLQGQTVTFSCMCKQGGSFSGNIILQANYSTSSDAYSSLTTNIGSSTTAVTSSTVWQLLTYTFVVPATAVGLKVGMTPSNGATGQVFDTAQWKLEIGSVATPFIPELLSDTYIACQRYYEKSYDNTSSPGTVTEVGSIRSLAQSANYLYSTDLRFKVVKRAAPTMSFYGPQSGTAGIYDLSAANTKACNSANVGTTGCLVYSSGGVWITNNTMEYQFVADARL